MGENVKAALVGGVCAIIAAFISYAAVVKSKQAEITGLKTEIQSLRSEKENLFIEKETLSSKLKLLSSDFEGLYTNFHSCTKKLKNLVGAVESFNNSTFIQWYGTNNNWTGFGKRKGKDGKTKNGEDMLQCAAGRFVQEWGRQFENMRNSGCNIRNPNPVEVKHGDHCDLLP